MKLYTLRHLVEELSSQLAGARISKIHQPEAEKMILRLWTGTNQLRLLVSVAPGRQELFLTSREWLNPRQPPRFCQLLRSRISRIDRFRLINDDRVVQFDCSGPKGSCCLIVEMFGSSGNMILTDEHLNIIDVLKRDTGEISGRSLLAGKRYNYPEKKSSDRGSSSALPEWPENISSWSNYCEQQATDATVPGLRQNIQRQLCQAVVRHQKKLARRLDRIHQDLDQQQSAQEHRIKGNLLLAHLHRIEKGMEKIRLDNIFSAPAHEIEIVLDPKLSPQQNAQSYFKKYQKAGRGVDHSHRRLEETRLEIQWLDEVLYQLGDEPGPADLETIYTELADVGLLKTTGGDRKKRTRQASEPQEFVSPSGIRVMRGRNNQHNNLLSGRHLKRGDLWFHAHQSPGAHVLLKVSAGSVLPTEADIHYAAAIAAGYSRARHDAKVEVMMATADNVSRPKGAPPGMVTVKKYNSLIVVPFRPE